MIDTTNKFFVGVGAAGIVFLKPLPQRLTPDDALVLAAYLVSMAEMFTDTNFSDVQKAVNNA